ncbi:response regulator [Pseudomonas sp. S75]|uniref:response regulator n=1 Tax=unclassified Pseudomonas TaxID=196821 RepID=UPI001908BCE3|nr:MULTISPECIES: response regulator [unclassified Pseudomonas]MBJ9977074.1 response regulator [Pseudomonas sp. S30]MBK0154076.1 response regulator [Pseudomonas sp. S75]
MKILIIEDNIFKREKIINFLDEHFDFEVEAAASYNSGLSLAMKGGYEFIVLDMSMPTFDRSDTAQGGRFRTVAGKEIALKLKRLNKLVPFVVVTGYSDFSVDSKSLSIEQIDDLLSAVGDMYKGYVKFDSSNSVWKDQLLEVVVKLK